MSKMLIPNNLTNQTEKRAQKVQVQLLVRALVHLEIEGASSVTAEDALERELEQLDEMLDNESELEFYSREIADSDFDESSDAQWTALGCGWTLLDLNLPFAIDDATTEEQIRIINDMVQERLGDLDFSDDEVWVMQDGVPKFNLYLLCRQSTGHISRRTRLKRQKGRQAFEVAKDLELLNG